MKTAFVYSTEDISALEDKAEIAKSFEGTKLQYDTNHLVVLQASASDDLSEFHEQVVEYANANTFVEVYFYGLDIQFIRRVVFELMALGASVVFQLTPFQRDFIWSQTA